MNEVLAFVAVVRGGSFTEAGRRMGVPKSTLSRQVARLEEHLGTRLLHRTTRKLSLTETGHAYFERCRSAIEDIENAERVVQNVAGNVRGQLRVTIPEDGLNRFVAPIFPEFRERYPDLDVVFVCAQRRIDIVAEGFDVAVRGGMLPDADMISRKIGPSNVVWCASPEYLQRRGTPKTIEDLADHDGVMMTSGAAGFAFPMIGPKGPVSYELRHTVAANAWSFLLAALLQGLGVGPMLVPLIREELADGRLVRVLPEYGLTDGGFYACYPSRHHLSPKVRVFVDFLVEKLGPVLAK